MLTAILCNFVNIIPHHYTLEVKRSFLPDEYSDSYAEFLYYDNEQWRATQDSVSIVAKSGG